MSRHGFVFMVFSLDPSRDPFPWRRRPTISAVRAAYAIDHKLDRVTGKAGSHVHHAVATKLIESHSHAKALLQRFGLLISQPATWSFALCSQAQERA